MDKVERVLEKLERFKNSKFPILSVYLGVAQKKSTPSAIMSSMFHSQVHQNLTKEESKIFKGDIERIDDYLRTSYDSRGRRSAVFFTAGKKLWEILDFEFYLAPLCLTSYSPYIRPVIEALGKYNKYLVLLADREKARMFTVHLGNIEEHKDVFDGIVPQRVKAIKTEWGRYDKIERHIEDHLHRHLQLIAKAAEEFVKDHPVTFVILGGNDEMIPKVKKHLTYPLNKMVVGELVTEVNIPLNAVFLESKKIAAKLESR